MYSQPRTQSSDTRYTLNGYSSADHEVAVDSNAAYSMNGSYYDQQNGVGQYSAASSVPLGMFLIALWSPRRQCLCR